MEANSHPTKLKVPLPSRDSGPKVHYFPEREILGGEGVRFEIGASLGIYKDDNADDPGVSQGSRDLPQDHAAPIFLGYREARRPMCGHSGRERIPAR